MRWTRQRRARAVTQGGSSLRVVSGQPARRRTALLPSSSMLRWMGTKPARSLGEDGSRTVKPCGPGTRCWCQVRGGEVGLNRVRSAINLRTTVTRRIRRRGERGVSRKTIAQGRPDCLGRTCGHHPCALFLAQGAMGAASARSSLRPLLSEEHETASPRARSAPREGGVISAD